MSGDENYSHHHMCMSTVHVYLPWVISEEPVEGGEGLKTLFLGINYRHLCDYMYININTIMDRYMYACINMNT
jgi:hypothetical protein